MVKRIIYHGNFQKHLKDVESKAFTLGDWTNIVRVIPGQTTNKRYLGIK